MRTLFLILLIAGLQVLVYLFSMRRPEAAAPVPAAQAYFATPAESARTLEEIVRTQDSARLRLYCPHCAPQAWFSRFGDRALAYAGYAFSRDGTRATVSLRAPHAGRVEYTLEQTPEGYRLLPQ